MRKNPSTNASNRCSVTLPPEILGEIAKHVWEQSVQLNQVLNWHATSKSFWETYIQFDDEKMLLFCEEKKRNNQDYIKRNFKAVYSKNLIEFAQFEAIIHICKRVKKRILEIDQEYVGIYLGLFHTKIERSNFPLSRWDDMQGMRFSGKDDVLCEGSLDLLRAATPRIRYRYGWEFTFRHTETLEILYAPWSEEPIKKSYICFLEFGDCSYDDYSLL